MEDRNIFIAFRPATSPGNEKEATGFSGISDRRETKKVPRASVNRLNKNVFLLPSSGL